MFVFDFNKSFVIIVCSSFLCVFYTFAVNAGEKGASTELGIASTAKTAFN